MEDEEIKKIVREEYSKIAKTQSSCCEQTTSCCGSSDQITIKYISKNIGYSIEEIEAVPEGANLGLGCGNPTALASLEEGEIVLDLGSGAGFDCFLAAKKVGDKGKVIGVDMTSDMIAKARENAKKGGYNNVEFRLGEIERLPVEDNSVDVIISNCVINLVPDKFKAFQEAFRVLKPGGRLMISDITLLKKLPDFVMNSIDAYIGCVSGAILRDDYIKTIRDAGFESVKILDQTSFPIDVLTMNPKTMELINELKIPSETLKDMTNSVVSVKVEAKKQEFNQVDIPESTKLKVDIYVPLNACACEWSQFVNLVFAAITPYIKHIDHETISLQSEEARQLNLHDKCVIVDGVKKYVTSHALKQDLPKLLKEKSLR